MTILSKQFILCASLMVSLIGCKKPSASSVKSLDNFAAGRRVKTNVCSGDPALANEDGLNVALSALTGRIDYEAKGDKTQLELAVKTAFSAVPPDIQNLFLKIIFFHKHTHKFPYSKFHTIPYKF